MAHQYLYLLGRALTRWYKLPVHMIIDLGDQGISKFVPCYLLTNHGMKLRYLVLIVLTKSSYEGQLLLQVDRHPIDCLIPDEQLRVQLINQLVQQLKSNGHLVKLVFVLLQLWVELVTCQRGSFLEFCQLHHRNLIAHLKFQLLEARLNLREAHLSKQLLICTCLQGLCALVRDLGDTLLVGVVH